jgi:hypothetical protein
LIAAQLPSTDTATRIAIQRSIPDTVDKKIIIAFLK